MEVVLQVRLTVVTVKVWLMVMTALVGKQMVADGDEVICGSCGGKVNVGGNENNRGCGGGTDGGGCETEAYDDGCRGGIDGGGCGDEVEGGNIKDEADGGGCGGEIDRGGVVGGE